MRNRWLNSVMVRTSLLIIMVEALTLFALGYYYRERFARKVEHEIETRLRTPGKLMQHQLARYDMIADRVLMTELVGETLVDGMVVGAGNKVFYALHPEHEGKDAAEIPGIDPRWFSPDRTSFRLIKLTDQDHTYLVGVTPLVAYSGAKPFFYVYVKVNTRHAEQQKRKMTWLFLFGSLGCMAVSSLVLIGFMRVVIINPLEALEKTADRFAKEHIDDMIRISRSDEIGRLARSFRNMRDVIHQKIEELRNLNDTLEQKVEKRTGELFQQTRRLQREISERKQTEEALQASERRFRQQFQSSPIPTFIWKMEDQGLVFIDYNTAVNNMTKGTAKNFLGMSAEQVYPDRPDLIDHFHACLRDRKTVVYETPYKARGTKLERVIVFTFAFVSPDLLLLHTQDITDYRQAEARLKEYSNHLESMVEEQTRELHETQAELLRRERLAVLGHFAGSVAHELRNPLATIDSAAYLLNIKLKGDEKIEQILGRVTRNVRQSNAIIQSLLDLSQMKKPAAEPRDLADLIQESLKSSRIPDTVAVVVNSPQDAVYVQVDFEQIRMAFKNVIQNAVQAMQGEGKLTVSIEPQAPDRVAVTIADTGPGVASEHLEKVFEPLFTTKVHGIGFGLSITKMIIENHGGAIRAESELGHGAAFVITLKMGVK